MAHVVGDSYQRSGFRPPCGSGGSDSDSGEVYSDASVMILAQTDGVPHNTITPIARMRNGKFELDLHAQ